MIKFITIIVPPPPFMAKIAKALGVSIEDLL